MINKNKIIFLDTNILSDIGRFDEKKIRDIVFIISVKIKLIVVLTPFNILEIEKIPDEEVKKRIHYFLNLSNIVYLKGMDILFADEIMAYRTGVAVNPMQFKTTLISKSKDGKPANYQILLQNLLDDVEYHNARAEHNALLDKLQERYQQKQSVSEEVFAEYLFREHLIKVYPDLVKKDWRTIADCCPSYMAYVYSLYDKIGSKGLRKKAGEMNDTAMSYIFPYVGIVVTEKRQASVFNRVKAGVKIHALSDTIILKYSDVFKDGEFQLQEALGIEEQ